MNPFESGVPLGGLGCGKLELCGDGAIRSITIHNNIDQPFSDAKGSNAYAAAGLRHAFAFVQVGGVGARILKYADDAWFDVQPPGSMTFQGNYPCARLNVEPLGDVHVSLEAFSPLIANEGDDYKRSSLPVAVFALTVKNESLERRQVTVGFSWPHVAGLGGYPNAVLADLRDNETEHVAREGYQLLRFYHSYPKVDRRLDGEYALLAPQAEGVLLSWSIASWSESLWARLRDTGRLTNGRGSWGLGEAGAVTPGNTGIIAATMELGPGESRTVPFTLSWFFPDKPANRKPGIVYRNAYAKHFDSAESVAAYVTEHREELRQATLAWQAPLFSSNLPDWLKTKLVNNLFPLSSCSMYLSDGRFSINESPTYMAGCMGTIDQRAAAATASVMCFPETAKSELSQFARQQISAHHPKRHGTHWNCRTGAYDLPLDRLGAIKHEIGWDELEEGHYGAEGWTNLHWPDLTSVFVLQCYQQLIWTGDMAFLDEVYPRIKDALAFQKRLDQDGDGVAELWGPGSSTFDNHHFPYYGASSYVASLYLAAIKAAMKLASLNGDDSYVTELEVDFARTRETMEARLWDEARGYYISWHDPGHRAWDGTERAHGEKSENSMIASLAGVWYAAMLDLGPILDPVRVRSALTKLYERNVKPVRYCAANEARPDGTSSFSWPFYAENYFAANAIYHGQSDNGLEMVRKFYEAAFVKSRSPWNIPLNWAGEENGEPEWGKWYMTNPSSWTVLLALSGVRYNAFDKSLVIEPNVPESLGELRGVPVFMPRFRARVTDTGNVGSFKVDKIIGADRLSVRALGLRVNGAKSIRLNGAELDLARDERATEAVRYVGVLELEAGDEITWTQTEAPAS